jgi:hypothetical protein
MKDDLIFAKTAAGEEAIRERTRLVQRNLRTVLIVVDGIADVAALKRSIGDAVMVDSALAELELMGLIVSLDSTQKEDGPDAPREAEILQVRPPAPNVAVDVALDKDKEALIDVAATGGHSLELAALESHSGTTGVADWWSEKNERHLETQEEELYDRAYGLEDHTQMAVVRPATETQPPRMARKAKYRIRPFVGIAAAAALILAILRVVLYPYDEYRPQFEQRLSRALSDEVKIGNVRVNFVPMPVIVLEKVSVGVTPYASVDLIRMVPEPISLFGGGHKYAEVQLDGVRIADVALGRISQWMKPAGMGDASVGKLVIDGLAFDFAGGSIGNLAGGVDIDPQLGIIRMVLRARQGDFQIEAVPKSAGVSVAISASNWQPPMQPALMLSALDIRGELMPGRLVLDKIDGRAYDGLFGGSGLIVWGRDAGATLKLDLKNIAAGQLIDALGGPSLIEGAASGKLAVAANASAPNRLAEDLRLNGTFKVLRGRLSNIDLAGALRASGRASGGVVRGGGTNFEELAGNFAADSRSIRIVGATLSSGLLRASGQATISRQNRTISGSTTVNMTASAGQRHASVMLSGNAARPELKAMR